jgi:ribulose kinase
MGAAICASLALGVYRDRHEAIEHMVRRKDTFSPVPEHVNLYREINEKVYTQIVPRTDELLKRSHEIINGNHH